MMLLLITVVALVGYAALIWFYHHHWQRLPLFREQAVAPGTFLSVIVPARNEEKRLPQLLQALKAQTYPSQLFEVLLVDDYSTDRTAAVALEAALPNLVLLRPDVPAAASSKKKAIETAVSHARGPFIIATDADCVPPAQWLQTVHDFFLSREAAFIAAPVKFSYQNNLLQIFQALDFLTLQGITAASVASGLHAMCNGANMAYTKSAFAAAGGFAGIDQVATGDDMLLMHKIWRQHPGKVGYLKSKSAIVSTPPMQSWKAFLMQRRRWASKTFVYSDWRIIAVLAFVYGFNLLFFVWLTMGFFQPQYLLYALGFLLLKTAIEWPFVSSVAQFYGERKLMKWFLLFQPLHLCYTVAVGLLSQWGAYEWKGRRTR